MSEAILTPTTSCPVAHLQAEANAIAAQIDALTGATDCVFERLLDRLNAVETTAAAIEASSIGGLLFQLVLIRGAALEMTGYAGPDAQSDIACLFDRVDTAVTVVTAALERAASPMAA